MDTILSNLYGIFAFSTARPLLFTRLEFWLFFLVLAFGYAFIKERIRARTLYLLAFSLFFYYKSCGYFFALILLSVLVNYYLGALVSRRQTERGRKGVIAIAVAFNLLLLAYFKYMAFFIGVVNDAFGTEFQPVNVFAQVAAALFGDDSSLAEIILPVGISFYTFQAISYVVDVYRREIPPLKSIADFAFYLAFFPQLVAGPIVRAKDFIPQIARPFHLTKREAAYALFLILTGLLKKNVFSDYIALNLVDRVFSSPASYTGLENLMASYGYAMQIYCDFSGYTDIAIGVALLLGFRLTVNFNFPYKASSLSDFWRRWHISLSTWLRDYLYIPLGGNRHGMWVMFFSLFATMLLGGLWHGASWNFILWGAFHGLGLVLGKLLTKLPGHILESKTFRFVRAAITFHIVVALWIFFRAQDLTTSLQVFAQIFGSFHPEILGQLLMAYTLPISLIALGFLFHWLPSRWHEQARGAFISSPVFLRFALAVLVALILLKVQSLGMHPFIYFDF
ncbi:MAG: membrane-bound O-acyltransferase family protein [Bacteroidetes bacterium]|nr:MAG: membrane-bound O-acyltransferase family protein [Bacteroidota bacterium]